MNLNLLAETSGRYTLNPCPSLLSCPVLPVSRSGADVLSVLAAVAAEAASEELQTRSIIGERLRAETAAIHEGSCIRALNFSIHIPSAASSVTPSGMSIC